MKSTLLFSFLALLLLSSCGSEPSSTPAEQDASIARGTSEGIFDSQVIGIFTGEEEGAFVRLNFSHYQHFMRKLLDLERHQVAAFESVELKQEGLQYYLLSKVVLAESSAQIKCLLTHGVDGNFSISGVSCLCRSSCQSGCQVLPGLECGCSPCSDPADSACTKTHSISTELSREDFGFASFE